MESPAASVQTRRSDRARVRRIASFTAKLGPVGPIILAVFALREPWAQARVVGVFGATRSPEAVALLLGVLVLAVVAAQVASRRGPRPAGIVHVAVGIAMALVAVAAYRMIRDAGVKALWVIPVASVRPGRGLALFAAAALGFLLLGTGEIFLSWRAARRRARRPT